MEILSALFQSVIGPILNGGAPVIGLLLLFDGFIYLLFWFLYKDKNKQLDEFRAEIKKNDERMEAIIEKYHNGLIDFGEALQGLERVMHEIKGMVGKK